MFRQVRCLLLRSPGFIARGAARSLSSGPPAPPAQDAAFIRSRRRVDPNIKPPKTALSFMQHYPPPISSKLPVNLAPYKPDSMEGSFFTEQPWTSGRKNQYKKFEKHLEDCDNIKDGMTIDEVLKLPEVDSFRTRLNERDRLLCVWMHMTRLQKEVATSQFKAFLIHLLKPDLPLELHKGLFSEVKRYYFSERYTYLPHQLIDKSLWYYMGNFMPLHEKDGRQSEDTRKRIKKYIEKLYEKKRCHARWFANPTKRFDMPFPYRFKFLNPGDEDGEQ